MNVKKAIKRIVALGTGAALMGATVLGAMAADLNDFPAPFVKDGQFNAMIVIGEAADTPDVIGAVDIATTLQYEMKEAASTTGATGSSVSVAGDAFQIRLDNTALEIGDTLGGVVTAIEDGDLSALAGGTFADEDYTETISLYDGKVVWEEPADGDYEDEPGLYLKWANDETMYVYDLEFPQAASSTNTSNVLDDFEDKTIRFMGRAYTISSAKLTGTEVKLTLLGGDSNDVIEEYSTKTYTVNGKEYEVEATYIGQSSAKFRINGEVTDALAEGETYELNDGTEIGVREILENEAGEGGQDIVEFYLGANKIVLGSDVAVSTDTNNLIVGDETYNNVKVKIMGNFPDSSTFELEGIQVNVTADDDYWLAPGDKLSQYVDGSNEDYMFGNVDFLYEGITEPASSAVELKARSEYQYNLEFTTVGDLDYTLPLWYAEDGDHSGDEDGKLVLASNVSVDQMFIVGTSDANAEDVKARVYRFTDYDKDDRTITIKDLAGDSVTLQLDTNYQKSYRIDGRYHNFALHNYSSSVGGTISVDGRATEFGLDSGAYLGLTENGAGNYVTVNITVPADLVDSAVAERFGFVVNSTTTDTPSQIVDSALETGFLGSWLEVKSDVDETYSDKYGVMVTRDDTGDDTEYTFDIPFSQRLPQVFAVSGDVSTSEVAGVSGSAFTIAPVSTGIAMLDTEVGSSWKSNNAIVVGGPCVNTVAAELMGNPAECTEGFTQGNAMIKLFSQSGGKVSMLVAGYSADDTRRAATAVHKFRSYSGFKGTEVKVSGTSMSDISVTSVQ